MIAEAVDALARSHRGQILLINFYDSVVPSTGALDDNDWKTIATDAARALSAHPEQPDQHSKNGAGESQATVAFIEAVRNNKNLRFKRQANPESYGDGPFCTFKTISKSLEMGILDAAETDEIIGIKWNNDKVGQFASPSDSQTFNMYLKDCIRTGANLAQYGIVYAAKQSEIGSETQAQKIASKLGLHGIRAGHSLIKYVFKPPEDAPVALPTPLEAECHWRHCTRWREQDESHPAQTVDLAETDNGALTAGCEEYIVQSVETDSLIWDEGGKIGTRPGITGCVEEWNLSDAEYVDLLLQRRRAEAEEDGKPIVGQPLLDHMVNKLQLFLTDL